MNRQDNNRARLINLFLFFVACWLVFAFEPCIFAQHGHHASSSNERVKLIPGAGHLNHPVSTQNVEAQKFFNQGLALIYGFNHEEARRSFEFAARLDPQLAMAFWGIALAVGPNYNEAQVDLERVKSAYEAVQRARALAGNASEAERAYIEALAKRFSLDPQPDFKQLGTDYKNAMGDLSKRYPDDLDAATLYADSLMNLTPWQLWTKDGKPTDYTSEIVSTLESVLKREANHLGANHLYIHAVEASKQPDRALASANRLGGLAPASGHLVHMPAHIYIRTGDNQAAAKANEKAAQVDLEYIKRTGARGIYPAMYYSHNLHFLVESYNRSGNYQLAIRSAQRLENNVRNHLKEMPMIESFLPSVMFVQLRFGRWGEIFKLPEPGKEMPVTNVFWHFARGVAFAGTGKIDEAQKEREVLGRLARDLPGETPFGLNTAAGVLKIAESALDARIAAAKGDRKGAIDFWRKAVAAQDDLNYDEPPGWYYPVRESLAAALLFNGEAEEAEKVFRKDLEYNPRSGRSLLGLAESLKKQGKLKDARAVQREFVVAWKNADTKLKVGDL
jgi:tetratricopeptide (TPR) repeat protein